MRPFGSVMCWLFGHKWEWHELIYRQSKTFATSVEASGDLVEIPVTWVNDERCKRCGKESWWPS